MTQPLLKGFGRVFFDGTEEQEGSPLILWAHLKGGGCTTAKMTGKPLMNNPRWNLVGFQHLLHQVCFPPRTCRFQGNPGHALQKEGFELRIDFTRVGGETGVVTTDLGS